MINFHRFIFLHSLEKSMKSLSIDLQVLDTSVRICCCCQTERAILICSNCQNDQSSANGGGGSDKMLSKTCLAISLDVANEQTSLSIEPATNDLTNNSKSKINIESLIRNGNMFYCNECFVVVHHKMPNSHMPIGFHGSKKQAHVEPVVVDEPPPVQTDEPAVSITEQLLITENNGLTQNVAQHTISPADKEKMRHDLNYVLKEIESLNRRHAEFNGVKQSIRQMNDLVRDDMMLDFSATADVMKTKLDELTLKVKERLKDAYSTVRDIQDKV